MQNTIYPQVYATKHQNRDTRMASQSGGVFTACSDVVLAQQGVVYGCVLNEQAEAVHVRATDEAGRDCMRGSKYVQSHMKNVFHLVKEDLGNQKQVLFTGTPCQVAGLKRYLEKVHVNTERLFCVDIVCHSVPSPLLWAEFVNLMEQHMGGIYLNAFFRDKRTFGWHTSMSTLVMNDPHKDCKIIAHSGVFGKLFGSYIASRPACHYCSYKKIPHPSDLTIGDFWGVENCMPELDDNKGVSICFINTEKGKQFFDQIQVQMDCYPCTLEECLQPALQYSFPPHPQRTQFWEEFQKYGFAFVAKKYGDCDFEMITQDKIREKKIDTPHTSIRFINETVENDQQTKKPLPQIYTAREKCCGCSACQAICSTNAIAFQPDEEGFWYPVVDASHCVRCYRCMEVCAF